MSDEEVIRSFVLPKDAYGQAPGTPRAPLTSQQSLEDPFPVRSLQQQQPQFAARFPSPAPRVADPCAGGKPRLGQPPPPPHMMQQVHVCMSTHVPNLVFLLQDNNDLHLCCIHLPVHAQNLLVVTGECQLIVYHQVVS